jgi:hypothetical protein
MLSKYQEFGAWKKGNRGIMINLRFVGMDLKEIAPAVQPGQSVNQYIRV